MKQTFAGDHRDFERDSFIGTLGRFFRPITADFDGTNTVITYERVELADMPAQFGHFIDRAEVRADIATLFGGKP